MTNGQRPAAADQRASAAYRPDIDGLRALAVLPIVAFHLDYPWMSGGFVGVDIFFVISGYLIGASLLRHIREGRYSVSDFYFRRLRRIAPALMATLSLTTIACAAVLLPNAFKDYAKSLVMATLFGSNVWFLITSNYFGADARTMPLLHTWSLAVEEQFYIAFPLVLLVLRRAPRHVLNGAVTALLILSLAASAVFLARNPAGTFYLLPTRLWELLVGVLAAEIRAERIGESRRLREVLAWLGFILIAGALCWLRPTSPFPGLAAVPPCLGTALLLSTGGHGETTIARLLSLPMLVWFGLISYSLYLWHWPVIVLAAQAQPLADLSNTTRASLFGVSVLLAWMQWRWIERPWRAPSVRRRTIFTGSVLGGLVLCATGGAIYLLRGVPQRFDASVVKVASMLREGKSNDFRPGCMTDSDLSAFDRRRCLDHDPTRPNVLILGDSHAAHLWSGLSDDYPKVHFLQATASSCKPLVDRVELQPRYCQSLMSYVFNDYLIRQHRPWVLLGGSWELADEASVGRTIDWIRARGGRVILAGPVVRYQLDLPLVVAAAMRKDEPSLVDQFRRTDSAGLDARFARIAAAHGALYMSTYKALCGGRQCRVLDDEGLPVQFDYGHLTRSGARIVARAFPVDAVFR